MIEQLTQGFTKHWPVFLALFLLFGVLATLIITFVVGEKRNEKYKSLLEDQSNSVRIFIIDFPNDSVTYFNVTALDRVSRCSIGDFYKQFPIAEQKKVINWINAIADPYTEAPDYLETDIQENRSKRQYFSLLQVESVDSKRQIIHLQSYLLKYMSSRGESGAYHGLSTVKEVESAIQASGGKKGFSAVYRFAYKRIQDKDKEIAPLVFNQLKNALFPYVRGKRYLMQCSGNELYFCDLRLTEKAKARFLFREGLNAINRYLSLNGYASSIEVRVGAVEHALFHNDPESIIGQARTCAQIAFEDTSPFLWYEKGRQNANSLAESSYRTEVERIINDKKLSYFFRPIYSPKEKKVIGYFSKAEPKDTYFDSIEELKDYASRTDDLRSLFSTISRQTLSTFLSERINENESLFFPVRVEERGYLLVTFGKLARAKSAHLVFLFNEEDVRAHLDPSNPDTAIDDMRLIKAKGYEVGLFLNSAELRLPTNIYSAFDYFICGFAFAGSASEMDSKIRSQLHALVEKLLKYNKPIIANDIEGWASVELLVRSGLKYVSAEVIAPYDVMVKPVSAKSIKRINDMLD